MDSAPADTTYIIHTHTHMHTLTYTQTHTQTLTLGCQSLLRTPVKLAIRSRLLSLKLKVAKLCMLAYKGVLLRGKPVVFMPLCVCVCVRVCVRARARVCACVYVCVFLSY